MPTWIKICATTSVEDALASVAAGADALGFVFAPSARRVSPEQAQEIAPRLPGKIERVGVFVNESPELIRAIVEQVGLTAVQLHGEETPEFVASLFARGGRGRRVEVIKTILANDQFETKLALFGRNREYVDSILVDSGAGSGKTFDWHKTHSLVAGHKMRFIIAGGLNPENVGAAVQKFSPWGVDVVSGVEHEPGRKDPKKLQAFIAAVRKVDQQ
jgi:phosphoribosylanthranilate isomerase